MQGVFSLFHNSLAFYTFISNLTGSPYYGDRRKRDVTDTLLPLDYDYKWFDTATAQQRSNNLRHNLLMRKRQKKLTHQRHYTNDTVQVDGITHYVETEPRNAKVVEFEQDFMALLSMKFYKYMYLRDNNWRTWRTVKEENGSDTVVFYKCENVLRGGCADSGFWVMEFGLPPCPYELLSVLQHDLLCVTSIDQLHQLYDNKLNTTCPKKIKFIDLTGSCNNPIKTTLRFQKLINQKVDRPLPTRLCNGRETCELLTIYTISPLQIVFRIINRTNDIVYSRVMRANANFACVENCGQYDPTTSRVNPPGIRFLTNHDTANRTKDKTLKAHPFKILRDYKIQEYDYSFDMSGEGMKDVLFWDNVGWREKRYAGKDDIYLIDNNSVNKNSIDGESKTEMKKCEYDHT